MGKIHLIELIPLSNTFDDELLNLAINYQANESLTYNETDFPNSIFSTKERVLLSVREKNGKFYELNTNLEIIQNDRKSIKKGYVTSRSFPYYIEEEKSDLIKDSEAIKLFLNTCTVRREKLESAVKNYILGITNNDIEIISYIDKIKNSNGKIVFKRIYIYDSKNKKYRTYILPLRNNFPNGNFEFNKYTDITFDTEIALSDSKKMLLYTTSEIINPDDNNFELLANVYELLTYPEHIKKALDKVIEMENAVEFSNHPRPKTKIKKNDLH